MDVSARVAWPSESPSPSSVIRKLRLSQAMYVESFCHAIFSDVQLWHSLIGALSVGKLLHKRKSNGLGANVFHFVS